MRVFQRNQRIKHNHEEHEEHRNADGFAALVNFVVKNEISNPPLERTS